MSDETNAFTNRLKKRAKHLGKWAKRWPTQAYRIYDRDMPLFPWTIDLYGQHAYIQYFEPKTKLDEEALVLHKNAVHAVIESVLSPKAIVEKMRRRQSNSQYEKQNDLGHLIRVKEGHLTFLINLHDYIDTGLFLDHRAMRKIVYEDVLARKKQGSVDLLNLFAYTCSFGVYAASAGASTCNVDLSNTYLNWGKDNYEINNIGIDEQSLRYKEVSHDFYKDDILEWLPEAKKRDRRFDIIVLDPPTFSRSKSMSRDLDIQRDHEELIARCLALLAPGGSLYFSTNFQSFKLESSLMRRGQWDELTPRTRTEDFRTPIHFSWRVTLDQDASSK